MLFGAQAVNAYCETERMTQDIDLLSSDGARLAEALRVRLAGRFRIAVRVCEVADRHGYRVYQVRKPKNRHLVDVRDVEALPAMREIEGVQVAAPVDLIALKILGLSARGNRPKGDTDRADLHRLLLAFPELKAADGEVASMLQSMGAPSSTLDLWTRLARERIEPDEDDDY